jgi:hypothetical protein
VSREPARTKRVTRHKLRHEAAGREVGHEG